ncbi:MAG: K(+)-transporting ATPase subunit C [Microcoleus sp. PH2017_22_RUC_O_B]|uniref:K(+)-transporting ATPase subunit C n=1 Tax=unclassified Microcoleus TaxID=2642155 RepID=UPI001DBA7A9D|nr:MULTISPECIES: K(+)-transporting ATPase subunit C [unclassified Microcoleus]MCC3529383.1 K(+)-transporting ATPase subunit C [Microcoleus sp. PH2017_21_RUC_O_A]MCC3541329.1 K(+)-transporting ATPase subunit C [Microcoleus sp. PH2017_22_RUC_O_B]
MRELIRAIRVTLVLWGITAIIYPLILLAIGQLAFNSQANGSLITNQGVVVGSSLIGQPFASERYFWSRPSTTNYSSFASADFDPTKADNLTQRTGVSGASNLAPSNSDLLKRGNEKDGFQGVQVELARLKGAGIKPTADLVYTSGSSLDPHISVESARAQIERVAKVRSLNLNQVEMLVAKNTDGRFIGIFGEPGVNVLKLNMALDGLQ